MKKISKIISIVALLSAPATRSLYAQNLLKHFEHAENVSIDRLEATDQYILGGMIKPAMIGDMLNLDALSAPLQRIQLEKVDDKIKSVWCKTYAADDEISMVRTKLCPGLVNHFTVGDVRQTADGGFIICGNVRRDGESSGCSLLPPYNTMFLLRTDGDGLPVWFKRYGNSGMLNSVTETPAGDFIACGQDSDEMGVIVYTKSNGDLVWAHEAIPQTPEAGRFDHSSYKKVLNYSGNFVVIGAAGYHFNGGDYMGTLATVIDAAGNFLQHGVIYRQDIYLHRQLDPGSATNRDDKSVAITGQSDGIPFTMAIDPSSLGVHFCRGYSLHYLGVRESWGAAIVANPSGNKMYVTGREQKLFPSYSWGMYMETDWDGLPVRYTLFENEDAAYGRSITFNQKNNRPVFSGTHHPEPPSGPVVCNCVLSDHPTFVVPNQADHDCANDHTVTAEDLSTEVFAYDHRSIYIYQIDDKAFEFRIEPVEHVKCGELQRESPTATNQTTVSDIRVSPNPAGDYVDVAYGDTGFKGSALKVYDITGRMLITHTVNGEASVRIDISSLLPGTYLLRTDDGKGRSYQSSFIKQ